MDGVLLILLCYFALLFFVAWFFSRKSSLESYFLNKRKSGLWLLTFSNVATIVGAGATVAIVSEVYNSGISYGIGLPLSLFAGALILGLMAKHIKRIGDKFGALTIVDFFEKRFDKKNKNLTAILQVFVLLIWTAVQAVAIASLASVLVGVDYEIALFLAAAVTILYTSLGGLKIDLISDFIQFWIIFVVFILLAILGFLQVGSFSDLFSSLPSGHLSPFAFGGISWLIGAIVLSGFLYLGNTSHWQRIFSAEHEETARKSFFYAIPFVLILGIVTLFLGLVAAATLSAIKPESAIFLLMKSLLPGALAGIGFAAVLAVIMSSIDSVLIGGSTIIYTEFFKKKDLESKKEILAARIITALFGILGFGIAFLLPDIITLSLLVTYLTLIFVPAIFAGIFSRKISSNASFFSVLIPSIFLFALYIFIGENTFLITTPLSVLIILFYDKLFRR